MPVGPYLCLLGGVIAAAAITVALAHGVGILAALGPAALVLAWLLRRA